MKSVGVDAIKTMNVNDGYLNENAKSSKRPEYLVYMATYANKTRTEGYLILLKADGNMVEVQATSGSGRPTYYPIPAGEYKAYDYEETSDKRFMKDGIGFYIKLSPARVWDRDKGAYRTGLLIHPARYKGTEGCIGIIDTYDKIINFQREMQKSLQINKSIKLFVDY